MQSGDKIGFGAWQIGGELIVDGSNRGWPPLAEEEAISIIKAAFTKGIRFFDTSNSYGNGRSESLLGKTLHGKSEVEYSTKFGWKLAKGNHFQDFSPQEAERSLKLSLARLQVHRVNHFLLHNPKPGDITHELLEKLAQMKTEGITENIGISSTTLRGFETWIDCFDTFELAYNPIFTANEIYFEKLKGKNIFIRSIFASGILLLDKEKLVAGPQIFQDWRKTLPENMFEQAVKFATDHPDREHRLHWIMKRCMELPVSKVIVGFNKTKQLRLLEPYLRF